MQKCKLDLFLKTVKDFPRLFLFFLQQMIILSATHFFLKLVVKID